MSSRDAYMVTSSSKSKCNCIKIDEDPIPHLLTMKFVGQLHKMTRIGVIERLGRRILKSFECRRRQPQGDVTKASYSSDKTVINY